MRKIIHIDMDAFFASVEQRNRPELRGKPVVVGGRPNSRGVVAAASYEARQFGIRSAMPSAKAAKLCPDAVFVRGDFAEYRAISEQIRAIFREFTDIIEPLSIDEAFLDVSGLSAFDGSATLMAKAIRERIFEQTELTASAGISYNKFLAKTASDINKPNGQYVITPQQGEAFITQLPIGRFYGVGKATEAKMHRLGIHNGADLRSHSKEWLADKFGKRAAYYYNIARAIDERPVRTHRKRKSVGAETTLAENQTQLEPMLAILQQRLEKVVKQVEEKGWRARTLTIKVKYANFTQVTRAHSFADAHLALPRFEAMLLPLLQTTNADKLPVRLLGVTLSGFEKEAPQQSTAQQMELF